MYRPRVSSKTRLVLWCHSSFGVVKCQRVKPRQAWVVYVHFVTSSPGVRWSKWLRTLGVGRVKKPSAVVVVGTGKLAADDASAFKELPLLRDFFLAQTYSDGTSERLPGTAILSARAGKWFIVMKDPSSCTMLKVSADTLDELWVDVELLLDATDAPWEHDPFEAARKPKGKKGR